MGKPLRRRGVESVEGRSGVSYVGFIRDRLSGVSVPPSRYDGWLSGELRARLNELLEMK